MSAVLRAIRLENESQHDQLMRAMADKHSDIYGLLVCVEMLPTTPASDLAVAKLATALVALEDARTAFSDYFLPTGVN